MMVAVVAVAVGVAVGAVIVVALRHHLFLLVAMRRWPDDYDLRMRRRELVSRTSRRRPIARHLVCRECQWTSSPFTTKRPPRWITGDGLHHASIAHGSRGAGEEAFTVAPVAAPPTMRALPSGSPAAAGDDASGRAGAVIVRGAQLAGGPPIAPRAQAPTVAALVDAIGDLVAGRAAVGGNPHEVADRLIDIAIKVADANGVDGAVAESPEAVPERATAELVADPDVVYEGGGMLWWPVAEVLSAGE